jgi:hypothetical protein
MVRHTQSESEARRIVESFERLGHKQMYWCEHEPAIDAEVLPQADALDSLSQKYGVQIPPPPGEGASPLGSVS